MLDFLRRKAQSPYIQATIVIIIVVFIFWLPKMGGDRATNIVATVNDETIDHREFQKTYEQTVSQYRDQLGGAIPDGLLESLGLKQQVIRQLVEERLVLQGGVAAGLRASNAEVQSTIQEMESFKENGIFNLDRYEKLLASSRVSAGEFEANIRADILKRKIMTHLGRFVRVSEADIRDRFARDHGEIKVRYAVFEPAKFTSQVTAGDDDLRKYYDTHQERYKTEPQVRVQYLSFLQGRGNNEVAVSDEDILLFYRQYPKRYNIPEKRQARHILIRAAETDAPEIKANKRQQAETILKLAKSGQDFAKLATQYSEDASAEQGGDLGFFDRGQMVPSFEEAAFKLKPGQVSDLVETRFGFHIIKLEKIEPGRVIPLSEARQEIIETLKRNQGRQLALKKANEAYEAVILAGSLEKGAAAKNIPLKESGFFSRTTPAPALAVYPDAVNAALTLKQGELSSLIETRDGYFVLYVAERKEPTVPPLNEVRRQVTQDFINDRANELARQAAETLLKAVKEGKGFAAAAAGSSSVKESGYYSRAKIAASGLPSAIAEAGLTLSAAAPTPDTPGTDGGRYFVLSFLDRRKADETLFNQQRAQLAAGLQQEKRLLLLNAWVEYLESQGKVTTNNQYL